MHKMPLVILLLMVALSSCKKERTSDACEDLKVGIAGHDTGTVKKAITSFIAGLQNSDYNESNLRSLCERISSGCGVTTPPICFDCIKTLPSQTEITITINEGGMLTVKKIDLSYTPANKIVFQNMHE